MEESTMRIKFNTRELLSRCVETGLKRGYNRAHKHTDNPSEAVMLDAQENAIMNEIAEILDNDETS